MKLVGLPLSILNLTQILQNILITAYTKNIITMSSFRDKWYNAYNKDCDQGTDKWPMNHE